MSQLPQLLVNDRSARFAAAIERHFSASNPVSDHELLHGRGDTLLQIERAFVSRGRHIFIFGERGIGKTSVARSASTFHQPSRLGFLTVQCEGAQSPYDVMRDIAAQLVGERPRRSVSRTTRVTVPGLSHEQTVKLEGGTAPKFSSINEAIAATRELTRAFHDVDPPVVIVDEYHKLESASARQTLAEYFRAISDQEIHLRFIICGVAETLDRLVSDDASLGRFLKPLPLDPISPDARMEILKKAAAEIDLTIDDETLWRSAIISDGYPYYVKLIGEYLFWAVLDDPAQPSQTTPAHFDKAIIDAAANAEANLKAPYEEATRKYTDDYEEVLWAFADTSDLERRYRDVYDPSYCRITRLRSRSTISQKTFYSRVRSLCDATHGAILMPVSSGRYRFAQSRLRGYVRLMAARKGVKLNPEHHLGERVVDEPPRFVNYYRG